MQMQHQQYQASRQSYQFQRQYKGPKAQAVPLAIPPVTQSATEVTDAARMQQVANQKKKGMNSTLLAGDPTQQQSGTGATGGVQTSNLLG